jgi:MacB-like periplasmic core domain
MATTLLPYNVAMRSRPSWTVFGALVLTGLAGCTQPRTLGAPQGSYTPGTFTVKIAETEAAVAGAAVTTEFFTAEGVRPLLGRSFVEPDFAKERAAVAILNHRYWVEQFQSSPAVIGSKIVVDGRPHVIVGVAPPAFQPEGAGLIWIPK